MMKKMMMLTLVLGMVAVANAGLIFQYDGVAISNGDILEPGGILSMKFDAPQTSYTIELRTEPAIMDTAGLNFAAGFLFGNGKSVDTAEYVRMSGDNFMSPVDPAEVWGGIVLTDLGILTIADLGGAGADSLAVTVVPEPMTLGLLGLGGLFLRRRK